MKKTRYPKLHIGQMGFVFREIGRVAPVILDRCEIVEIVNERYVMVIFKPGEEPTKIWSAHYVRPRFSKRFHFSARSAV